MNNSIKLYENKLDKYFEFNVESNVDSFLDVVDELVINEGVESIPTLLKYFDDNTEYSWILEILQGNILHFIKEDKGYKNFINSLEAFHQNAPRWCVDTLSIMLNDDHYFYKFKDSSKKIDRLLLDNILNMLKKDSPHHKEKIEELRLEMDKGKK